MNEPFKSGSPKISGNLQKKEKKRYFERKTYLYLPFLKPQKIKHKHGEKHTHTHTHTQLNKGEMRQTSQEINLMPDTYNETEKLLL